MLPKLQHPTYEIYLHSVGKKVRFRPFLVREEKLLLLAKESEDGEEIARTIKQIIRNCCIDDINVDNLPIFDIEMFFVWIRAKSIGEKVALSYSCNVPVTGEDGAIKPCGGVTPYALDLEKIRYDITPGHKDLIDLGGGVGVKMKYPAIDTFTKEVEDDYEATLHVITSNIDYVYDDQGVYKDWSRKELEDFVEDIPIDKVMEMRDFFKKQPKVILQDTIKCKKCGYEHQVNVESLYGFFI